MEKKISSAGIKGREDCVTGNSINYCYLDSARNILTAFNISLSLSISSCAHCSLLSTRHTFDTREIFCTQLGGSNSLHFPALMIKNFVFPLNERYYVVGKKGKEGESRERERESGYGRRDIVDKDYMIHKPKAETFHYFITNLLFFFVSLENSFRRKHFTLKIFPRGVSLASVIIFLDSLLNML